jgi:cytochrome b6-f complex iron-sulfur subunit
MGKDPFTDSNLRRRSFLRLAGGAAAAAAFGGVAGCAPKQEGPLVVEVPIDSIPEGGHLRVLYGEMPVELIRGPDGFEVRSLWCTHTGCEVKWIEDRQVYFCACHEGEFDAEGRVIAGPPPQPLGRIPFAVSETSVLVGHTEG